jgi:ComF family protein
MIFNDLLKLVFPIYCQVCGDPLMDNEHLFCTKCLFEMPRTNNHLEKENKLTELFYGRAQIEAGTSLFEFKKGSQYRKLLHLLKYKSKTEIGYELGKYLGVNIKESIYFNNIDFVVPVPLHPKKLKKRGYNQSALISKGIADKLQTKMNEETLIRTINTKTQTNKNKFERWENVHNVFKLTNKCFDNKHVLLVDDVITTGATIEGCINALQDANNVKISIATLAIV